MSKRATQQAIPTPDSDAAELAAVRRAAADLISAVQETHTWIEESLNGLRNGDPEGPILRDMKRDYWRSVRARDEKLLAELQRILGTGI